MIPNGAPAIPLATAPPAAAPAPPPMYAPPPMKPSRPIGVAILAILTILFGIIGLIGGLLVLLASGLIATIAPEFAGVVGLILILGVLVTLFSLLAIVSGVGLWRLRPWAWWLTMIVGLLSIAFSIGSFVVFPLGGFPYSIVLWLIILIYLIVVRKNFMPRPMGM